MKLRWIVISAVLIGVQTPALALDIKDVTFNTDTVGKVVFSHAPHLRKKSRTSANVSCKSCHNESLKKGARYTMAQMEQGESCGACHNGKTAFALKECIRCHKVRDLTIKVTETGPVGFTHQQHAGRQSCNDCHPKLFIAGRNKPVGMTAMEQGKSCGACHDGKTAFSVADCAKCHTVSDITFKLKETGPIEFTHREHAKRQSCNDCHTSIYQFGKSKPVGMAAMEKGRSCGACHNGQKAFAIADCVRCHPIKELTFPVKNISNARFSHKSHLAKNRCEACHPKLYRVGRGKPVGMAAMEKGKSCGACHDGKSAFTVTASCDFCH
jgi:c(7)-type cytochrome triheme protein